MALISCSSMFNFILNWLYVNFGDLWESIKVYFFSYLLLSGLISLAYFYYQGPIINPRAINLLEWFLKLISLVCMYFGTSFKETSISIIIVVTSIDMFTHLIIFKRIIMNFLKNSGKTFFEIFFL
jgi:hypothetical protein